jgi:1-deoxy-D-xylulose-5-phosphate reductoisomerase
MLVPIALGLSWPDRIADADVPVDWTKAQSWDFEPLDDDAFPAVALARRVGEAGGTWPAVYNAANEVAVDAFHEGRLRFVEIVDTVADVVDAYAAEPGSRARDLTLDDVLAADSWARAAAARLVGGDPRPPVVADHLESGE